MASLVLASTSRYRRALLERLGVPFECLDHGVDEDAAKVLGLAPDALALHLAEAKAKSVRDARPSAFILGSDQVVDLHGTILGKPQTKDAARDQLARMAGRTHRLVTAVALAHPEGRVQTHLDVHAMTLRPLTPSEIERYVDADEPLDCCGSYRIERRGIALFDRIEGSDFTAIEGLPLVTVAKLLRGAGFALP